MYYEVLYGPGMAMARVVLDMGESVFAQRGSLVAMAGGTAIRTGLWGNPLFGLLRRLTGSGGFLINRFIGLRHGADLLLASAAPGDVEPVRLRERGLMVRRGAFLASGSAVSARGAWGGFAPMLAGEGVFFLSCFGDGVVFLSAFGAIHVIELAEGERRVVERGCVLAYDRTVRFSVGRLGSLTNAFLMRRFFVSKFRGPGRVLVQNRNERYFRDSLRRGLPRLLKDSGTEESKR